MLWIKKKFVYPYPKSVILRLSTKLSFSGIFASDICFNKKFCLYENDPNEIHLLIGADFAGRLFTGEIKQISENLVAMHTRLGCTLMGESGESTRRCETLLSLHLSDLDISELWRLDTIGIKDLGENQSKRELEEAAKLHFLENVKRDHEGRYMVNLTWIKDHPPLTSCRKIAEKTRELRQIVRKSRKIKRLRGGF